MSVVTHSLRARRRMLVSLVLVFVLLLLSAWHWALRSLEQQVLDALGPATTLEAVVIAWPGVVEIRDLRVAAPQGWPAPDAVQAQRVKIVPDLRSLWTDTLHVQSVNISGGYFAVLRNPQGKLQFLPGLIGRERVTAKREGRGARAVTIDSIKLSNSALDFYDASIRREPVRLHVDPLHLELRELSIPQLDGRTQIEGNGTVKGAQRDGRVELKGWLEIATRESDLTIKMRGVDLVTLEPYLIRSSETGVERGALDLDLKSQVRQGHIKAPGKLVLDELELESGAGITGTFMGVPRSAVIASLKSGGDQIELNFELEGDLNSPQFSLNETLPIRVAVGMAAALGVELIDMVRDVGSFGGRALEASGEAIGELFGAGEGAGKDEK